MMLQVPRDGDPCHTALLVILTGEFSFLPLAEGREILCNSLHEQGLRRYVHRALISNLVMPRENTLHRDDQAIHVDQQDALTI